MNANYVFPFEVRSELSIAIAVQLEDYLRDGAPAFGLVGLDVAPVFVVKAGTGAPGDEQATATAQVIYPDDKKPGVPHVRVVSVMPESSPDAWGDDEEVSRWRVTLDCVASEFNGVITEGASPANASARLSDAVWALLSHFEAMSEAGFVNANATPTAPEAQGISMEMPISVTFEVYASTQE